MRQVAVLTEILPETEKWGIDAIPSLIATEKALGWTPDPLLRLAAIVPPDAERLEAMAARLRLSNAEAALLKAWATAAPVNDEMSSAAFERLLYRNGADGIIDAAEAGACGSTRQGRRRFRRDGALGAAWKAAGSGDELEEAAVSAERRRCDFGGHRLRPARRRNCLPGWKTSGWTKISLPTGRRCSPGCRNWCSNQATFASSRMRALILSTMFSRIMVSP